MTPDPPPLRELAATGTAESLAVFADRMAADPPRDPHAALAFVPLFQRADERTASVYPRLLDALAHPTVAPLVLDLANYLTRRGLVARHPAAERGPQLAALLGEVVHRLRRIEESPQEFASSPKELTSKVGDAVALVVGLCDALALSDYKDAEGKLRQALELSHRRVRTEAAAALARLGDEEGIAKLVELSAEPVVRLRALEYLDELGMADRADEKFRTPEAKAEGALAAWLAEPTHFGLPPTAVELMDARKLRWPGFDEPVDCYLMRYEYRRGDSQLTGIGIVGPVTHAFFADLQDLPPTDIYAAFAGWYAEHDEITETPADRLAPSEQAGWQQVREGLLAKGFVSPELFKLGVFFGQRQWVATAEGEGRMGVVIVADDEVHWHPTPLGTRPMGPAEVYYLHKGREIMSAFE